MADELRNEQGFAVGDIDPRSGRPVVAIIASNRSDKERAVDVGERRQAAEETHATHAENLAEREFAFRQQAHNETQTLAEKQANLDAAAKYYGLAHDIFTMDHETNRLADAADFLREAKDVPLDAADREQQLTSLHAKYPLSGGDPGVQEFYKATQPARTQLLEAKRAGDLEHQLLIDKGELPGLPATRKAYAAGLLNDEDFNDPQMYKNGDINHNHAAWVAAQRSGAGLGTKGETKEIADARSWLVKYPYTALQNVDDPEQQKAMMDLHKIYTNKVLNWEKERAGTLTAEPSPTPSKPRRPLNDILNK